MDLETDPLFFVKIFLKRPSRLPRPRSPAGAEASPLEMLSCLPPQALQLARKPPEVGTTEEIFIFILEVLDNATRKVSKTKRSMRISSFLFIPYYELNGRLGHCQTIIFNSWICLLKTE